ncbi:MAG: potassium channel family protein [Deltaproteobacteria bacterium]|nr:potassium channel family protein [Deltaproteobacteria bacterium]
MKQRHSRSTSSFYGVFSTFFRNTTVIFTGIFFGFVFLGALVVHLVEGQTPGSPYASFFESLWFTIVTITTVGYGDISPQSTQAKIWVMFQMLVGMGLVGVVTGNVASILVERNRRRALGLVRLTGLEGHMIICGWKYDMQAVLLEMMDANPGMKSSSLVLISEQDPKDVGELRRHPRLRRVQYVFGSHTNRTVLDMASISTAGKVVILSEHKNPDDKDRVDSRSVLAATTVESMNPVVYTVTEIVQPHYIHYLRQARVEEVVLGEEHSRSLLAAASLGDGMANVVSRFYPEQGMQIRVRPSPPNSTGKTFGEVRQMIENDGLLLVGLLENTGNLHDRKTEQLSRALKAPDYGESVRSLRRVKKMYSNAPLINPVDEFIIQPHTNLLVLLPDTMRQKPEESEVNSRIFPQARDPRPGRLFICGWKDNMTDLLEHIISMHMVTGRGLSGISVLSNMPEREMKAINRAPGLAGVRLLHGEPTDPEALLNAGIRDAQRVLILSDPFESSSEESDGRTVLTSIAVHELNRMLYKIVELQDPAFGEHLRIANVEEPVFTRRHRQVMLVQGSRGNGLASAVETLLSPYGGLLRVVDFPPGHPGDNLGKHAKRLRDRGLMLVGVINHCGNLHMRKNYYLEEAQVQPSISNAIEQLKALKDMTSNEALFHPGWDYIPGDFSRAIVISHDKRPGARR